MQSNCGGKLKCQVSTCPCPKAATCSPAATGCAPKDPAHGYIKGVTAVLAVGGRVISQAPLIINVV